jgi:hypothetical protein
LSFSPNKISSVTNGETKRKMHTSVRAYLPLWAVLNSIAINAQDTPTMAPIYLDNKEYFGDMGNVVNVSFPLLQKAFQEPNSTNETSVAGFDWTKPFPGAKISGHQAHLRIARNLPVPEEIVQNSTTTLASLTFSVPKAMMGTDGVPKQMDPSWYICRHIYVSTILQSPAKSEEGKSCASIPPQCAADLKGNLTQGWMTTSDDYPCSGMAYDPIPKACWETFGFARADVIGEYSYLLKLRKLSERY